MKLLMENWRKLLEGEVLQGPWKDPEEQRKNAEIINNIEAFIAQQMEDVYGSPGKWTEEQLNAFEQINNLLNDLFPSGD